MDKYCPFSRLDTGLCAAWPGDKPHGCTASDNGLYCPLFPKKAKPPEVLGYGREYTLLRLPDATYQPFVVAWKYNEDAQDWAQGHYFSDEMDATRYWLDAEREAEQ